MSIKEKFSTQEWSELLAAPIMAGNAVVAAAPSGPIGVIKEVGAMASVMAKLSEVPNSNELVQALLDEFKTSAEQKQELELPKPTATDLAAFKQQAVVMVKNAVVLATTKVGPDVAKGYVALILSVAQKAAEAAKEGGFLGFGGTQISEAEQKMLNELRTALAV